MTENAASVPGPDAPATDQPEDGAAPAPAIRSEVSLDRRSVATSTLIVLAMVAGFLAVVWLYGVLAHFLFLLLLSWLFAVSMNPGIRWLMAHGRSRTASAAITGSIGILAGLVLVAVFGDLLLQQGAEIVKNLPGTLSSVTTWSNEHFHTRLDPNSLTSSLQLGSGQVSGTVSVLAGGTLGVVDSIGAILLDLVTVLVFGFYIAAAGPHFLQTIARGMRPDAQRVFVTVADISAQKTGGYVGSKVILAALSALFHGIVFAAIGVPNWLPYALLVGITAQFVPLVGTYIGIILPVLATVFDTPWKALVIVVFAAIYQQIESYVFTPRVSKKTMDVNPAVALAAVFVGAAIWGPIGALIGIPLVAAGFAIADSYSKRYDLISELSDESAPTASTA